MTTSWEEASRCPRDETQGEIVTEQILKGKGKLVTLTCPNNRCKWFGTTWVVQVRPDGTIPDPVLSREKQYHAIPDDHGRTEEALQRALHQMRQPGGGEVTR